MAARELRRNSAATLSPTTLLHETFLDLPVHLSETFEGERHFLAYTARIMRGLVIDHLRARRAQKRGGGHHVTSLPTDIPYFIAPDVAIEQLGEAMEILASSDPRLAQVVDLKFFCGFSLGEIARTWQVSERTIQRDWDKARLRLRDLIDAQTHRHEAEGDCGTEPRMG